MILNFNCFIVFTKCILWSLTSLKIIKTSFTFSLSKMCILVTGPKDCFKAMIQLALIQPLKPAETILPSFSLFFVPLRFSSISEKLVYFTKDPPSLPVQSMLFPTTHLTHSSVSSQKQDNVTTETHIHNTFLLPVA